MDYQQIGRQIRAARLRRKMTQAQLAEAADLSDEARELLKLREDVLYDALYGQQYITAAMNEPAP